MTSEQLAYEISTNTARTRRRHIKQNENEQAMLRSAQVSNMAALTSSRRPLSDISNSVKINIHRLECPDSLQTDTKITPVVVFLLRSAYFPSLVSLWRKPSTIVGRDLQGLGGKLGSCGDLGHQQNPQASFFLSSSLFGEISKDEFECLKAQASQVGTEVDDDELFLQAVGGKNKKGTVYGLGMESKAYYPRSDRCSSAAVSHTPSVVSQMETCLKKLEEKLQATREELRTTREEQKQQRDQLIASLLARLEGPSSSHSLPPPS
ncbi:hypothetical protein Cgig2_001556 [Carnegiea gigantea]|uniref:Uncharacterized protein n=1 Tax=Carnegiea gigantea TaxID=171969 RepID=A0A9Q1QA15_9CARY|nr:hypothetical protein Cgig2_001556 [Carnegiea gigantea]